MNWLITHRSLAARSMAWIGIVAIVILSIVPGIYRPTTGAGHFAEHFAIFALVAAAFAVGYRLPRTWLVPLALLFCCLTELMQVPLPTRHARIGDLAIDIVGACSAIGLVIFGGKVFASRSLDKRP
jgi:VanZ family protein